MEQYILAAIGIVVSVALFLIGYRQTIGAKKERVSIANANLERILLRRIVQEDYNPLPQEIDFLIEGLARDHRVNEGDMLSSDQILNSIYTHIAASDLIHSDQRPLILQRITQSMQVLESAPILEERMEIRQTESRFDRKNVFIFVLGLVASGLGAGLAGYAALSLADVPSSLEGVRAIVIVFVISLTLIIVIAYIWRIRDRSEALSSETTLNRAVKFERDVFDILQSYGLAATIASRDAGYDFYFDEANKRTLVEVKGWSSRAPLAVQKQVIDRLRSALERAKAHEAWIVVRDKSIFAEKLAGDERIKIISIGDLRRKVQIPMRKSK